MKPKKLNKRQLKKLHERMNKVLSQFAEQTERSEENDVRLRELMIKMRDAGYTAAQAKNVLRRAQQASHPSTPDTSRKSLSLETRQLIVAIMSLVVPLTVILAMITETVVYYRVSPQAYIRTQYITATVCIVTWYCMMRCSLPLRVSGALLIGVSCLALITVGSCDDSVYKWTQANYTASAWNSTILQVQISYYGIYFASYLYGCFWLGGGLIKCVKRWYLKKIEESNQNDRGGDRRRSDKTC